MCGIAGIISANKNKVNKLALQSMTNAIVHRGPEADGFWINNSEIAGFGHRRLSIIDLSPGGAQPMHYLGRYTITYNGEIYNYIELKEELTRRNFTFTSESDTEVILAAYAHYGKDCLRHFDGMFAFALWDEQEQTLFCARDRFGEKPFYYYYYEDTFYFGSEMKALWAAGVPKEMNNSMLLNYLTIGYTSDPTQPSHTFFKDVYTLPPGHYLVLKRLPVGHSLKHEIDVLSYWDLDKESQATLTEHEAIEKFCQLFETSVKRRLRSDVPIGTSLSGGLDSSSIVATANKFISVNNKYQQASFSALFPGYDKDESRQIKLITGQFKLKSFTTTPSVDGLIKDFKKLQYHQEEPLQSASIYAQFKVYELAREHGVTVLLDGQGADEILGGYHKYYHWYWQQLIANKKWSTAKREVFAAKSLGVKDPWGLRNYVAAFFPNRAAQTLAGRAHKNQKDHPGITKDFLKTYTNKNSLDKPVVEKLNDILYYNTIQHGLQELLRYADRNSMAHSREVRLPFLSHDLVQFIFSLPPHFKIKNGFTKWLLRESMSNILPTEIAWRKDKVGFEPPQYTWMQDNQLQEYIRESKKQLVKKGILKKAVLDEPIAPQHAHDADNFDWRYLSAAHCL